MKYVNMSCVLYAHTAAVIVQVTVEISGEVNGCKTRLSDFRISIQLLENGIMIDILILDERIGVEFVMGVKH